MALTDRLTRPDACIAVVGATDDAEKYGGIIYRFLKRRGYKVMAVNPHRTEVDGDRAWPNLSALPRRPDIINLVVPASIGMQIVEDTIKLGWDGIWVQPGAGSEALHRHLEHSGMSFVDGDCIMVVVNAIRTVS